MTSVLYLTSCLEQCEHCTSPTGLAHTFSPIHYAAGAFFSLPFLFKCLRREEDKTSIEE